MVSPLLNDEQIGPRNDFLTGRSSRLQPFLYGRAPGLLTSLIVPTACDLSPQGSRGFVVRAEHAASPCIGSANHPNPGQAWLRHLRAIQGFRWSAAPFRLPGKTSDYILRSRRTSRRGDSVLVDVSAQLIGREYCIPVPETQGRVYWMGRQERFDARDLGRPGLEVDHPL